VSCFAAGAAAPGASGVLVFVLLVEAGVACINDAPGVISATKRPVFRPYSRFSGSFFGCKNQIESGILRHRQIVGDLHAKTRPEKWL
jgi:hypothetical protein